MQKNRLFFILFVFIVNLGVVPFGNLHAVGLNSAKISQLFASFKTSLTLSPRERKILAIGTLTPIFGLLIFAHFKLKLPWHSSIKAWHPDLDEEIYDIMYSNPTKGKKLYKYSYKQNVDIKKDKRFAFDELQEDLAIVCLTGVGDIPRLMFPAIHQKLFPTDHFYVVEFEDWEKKRVLATSLGQIDEIVRTLLALRWINTGVDGRNYTKIALFGESRGGAVAIQVIRMLQRIRQGLEVKLSNVVGIQPNDAEEIITKLQKTGIILKNPLLSVKSTAKHMVGKIVGPLAQYLIGPIMTGFRYNPFSLPEPIDAVNDWIGSASEGQKKQAHIPTLFVTAQTDEVLGNESDDQFFTNLQTSNGNKS